MCIVAYEYFISLHLWQCMDLLVELNLGHYLSWTYLAQAEGRAEKIVPIFFATISFGVVVIFMF